MMILSSRRTKLFRAEKRQHIGNRDVVLVADALAAFPALGVELRAGAGGFGLVRIAGLELARA